MGWDPTSSTFAMAAAPALPMLLPRRISVLTEVFFCQKSNEKARLPGGANRGLHVFKRSVDEAISRQLRSQTFKALPSRTTVASSMPQRDKSKAVIFTVLLAKPSNSNSRLRCSDCRDVRKQAHTSNSIKEIPEGPL